MNRRMFGNLWARRAQLSHGLETLRNAHLWRIRRIGDQPEGVLQDSMRDAARIQLVDPKAAAREPPLGNLAQKQQRNALNTWEGEGGATKLAQPR
jgi:hypothetical protein